jgi:PAS domain S-box-containing protein
MRASVSHTRGALTNDAEGLPDKDDELCPPCAHQGQCSQLDTLREVSTRATEQAQLYSHLLGAVPVPLCRIQAQGHIIDANRACEALLLMPVAALRGLQLPRFGLDDAACLTLQVALERARTTGQHKAPHIWFGIDGNPVLIDLHFSQAPESSSAEDEWIVALMDQTQTYREHHALMQAHDLLQEANKLNQELALVADRSPNVVMICDGLQRIRWVNTSFTQQTGYTLAEARGRKPTDLLTERDIPPEGASELEARLRQGGAIDRTVMTRRRKDGSTYAVEGTILPIQGEDGLIHRHIMIEQDISERLRAEAEREALLRAEASHLAKTEFLSRMSHNMRTPLNAVMGFAHLLKDSTNPPLSSSQKGKLDIIHQAGQQLLTLVDQALQLARLEHALEPYQSSRVELDAVVQECIEMLRDEAEHKNINLQALVQPNGLAVRADAQRTREILLNLLSNAIKYSPDRRSVVVQVSSSPDPTLAQVTVQDQGVGIAEADLPLLFRPFTRLESTRDMAQGHGIGLAISQRLAHLMQGTLSAQSQLGVGSAFTLSLPLAGDAPAAPSSTEDSRALPPLPALNVLCVEDNDMNRLLIDAVFSAYPQVRLSMASSLAEGLEAVQRLQPDVVLLDINLPDGNGLSLCQTVRQHTQWPQPLVIALSADALPEHIDTAMACGVDHYLVKPLQIRRLLDILSSYPH